MNLDDFIRELDDIGTFENGKAIIPICVDFDGTIVEHEYPKIGKENKHCFEVMRKFSELYNVGWILDTMRPSKLCKEAVKYIEEHGIKLYGIGKEPNQRKWTDSPKAYGLFSIDDRNIGVPLIHEKGKRPYVDWKKVEEILEPILQKLTEK